LVEYCGEKRFIPIEKEEYEKLIPPLPLEKKVETKKAKTKKSTTPRGSRKTSKKEPVRNNNKVRSKSS
jgi:hypothetical protein